MEVKRFRERLIRAKKRVRTGKARKEWAKMPTE